MQTLIRKKAAVCNPAYGQARKSAAVCALAASRGAGWFFTPILAPMLKNHWMLRILTGVGVIQVVLAAVGLEGWQCPIRSFLEVICPGCGLTRAVGLLLKGNVKSALQVHAFALPVLIVLILMAITSCLPSQYRLNVARGMAVLERRTGLVAVLLVSMILYWLLRVFEIL